jgi:hypothetical protein
MPRDPAVDAAQPVGVRRAARDLPTTAPERRGGFSGVIPHDASARR